MWAWNRCGCFVLKPPTRRTASWLRSTGEDSLPAGQTRGHQGTFGPATLKPTPDSRSPRCPFPSHAPRGVCGLNVTQSLQEIGDMGQIAVFCTGGSGCSKRQASFPEVTWLVAEEGDSPVTAGPAFSAPVSAPGPPPVQLGLRHTRYQQRRRFLGTC